PACSFTAPPPTRTSTLSLTTLFRPNRGARPRRRPDPGRVQQRALRRPRPRRRPRRALLAGAQRAALRRLPAAARLRRPLPAAARSEEHTSELQSREKLVCRLLLGNK